MVREEFGRVVLSLDDGCPQEHERPGGDDVIGRLPFSPNSFVGFLGALRHGAFEQAMDGRFNLAGVVDFAMGRDAHELQPGAYREALVEGQPDECPNLLWASVVPDPGYHLSGG